MKLGLLSDTHLNWFNPTLSNRLIDELKWVDTILHAGDLVCMDVLDRMEKITQVVAVHGNSDEPEVKKRLPRKELVQLGGLSIGLIHGDQPAEIESQYLRAERDYDAPEMEIFYQYLVNELPEAKVIVFGHFHKPVVREYQGKLLVNPGSVTEYKGKRTFALMDIDHYDEPIPHVEILTL